jgi:hypothetical protein
MPTPGLLGACSRARQDALLLDVDHNERRGLPVRAARAACAGLAPPKLVLGLRPAREWEGRARGDAPAYPFTVGGLTVLTSSIVTLTSSNVYSSQSATSGNAFAHAVPA